MSSEHKQSHALVESTMESHWKAMQPCMFLCKHRGHESPIGRCMSRKRVAIAANKVLWGKREFQCVVIALTSTIGAAVLLLPMDATAYRTHFMLMC